MKTPDARRTMKRVLLKLVWFLLVFLSICATLFVSISYLLFQSDHDKPQQTVNVRFTIPEGSTGRDIGRILAENGLIRHEMVFRLLLKLNPEKNHIKYGRYEIPSHASPREILDILRQGPNAPLSADEIPDELKLSIPEGLTIAQMSAYFEDTEAFFEAVSDPELIRRLGVDADTLEGFLFPNTYFFSKKPTPAEAVKRMVEEFERVYNALEREMNLPEGFDKKQIVTIASLIEEETKLDEERPLVSAVIYNRLKNGMTLDLDCTLQYALKKYGQRLLDSDKEVNSPYNTYRAKGLPPGPISNPGLKSLRAAFKPADEPVLYFVSNADGKSHTFSRTLAEHNRAVARYRREIAPQRLQCREKQRAEKD